MAGNLPEGYIAGATAAAFKKTGRDDLGIIFSEYPCELAALFTRNLFRAAPVRIDQEILASGRKVRAIVANSGQANSCTGEEGLRNCREIQATVAKLLDIAPDEVLLLSTGVIGAQFDMGKWRAAMPELVKSAGTRDAEGFVRAFMTTDAFPKFTSSEVRIGGRKARITVMAKGAGMICPNMATMLCVALTDVRIDRTAWQNLFNECVGATFNRVSVDGDTSTNDTILGLANGASEAEVCTDLDLAMLRRTLLESLGLVARMLVKDGEGAKRILHIRVQGAKDDADAETIARAVGNSQLVKTAVYGGDANWGRIVNAVGYSGAQIDPNAVTLRLCGVEKFGQGQPLNPDAEELLAQKMQEDLIEIELGVGAGRGEFELWASDLGHEYVSLNADYRS